jgi:hypothetical protein
MLEVNVFIGWAFCTHTPTYCNQDKSAARFGRQLAARVPNMFCNFYLVKSHIIANNSATTEAKKIGKVSENSQNFKNI